MRIEDFKLVKHPDTGRLMEVEWVEGPTKTRQGGLNKRPRSVTQKVYRIGGQKCPIACLEKLLSKRPADLSEFGPLYLCPLDWCRAQVWFSRIGLGINSIIDCIDYVTGIGNAHSIYWQSVFRLRARIYNHS